MIKIGDYEVVAHHTLLVPQNTMVHIQLPIANPKINVKIEFDNTTDEQGIQIHPGAHETRFIFCNWNHILGTVMVEPAPFVTTNDKRTIYFMACNYAIGDTNKLDLQFLLKVKGEG